MSVFRPDQRRRTGPTWRSRQRQVGLVGTCVVLLVGVIALMAWRQLRWRDTTVDAVEPVGPASMQLTVGYHCHPSARVLVTESAELVELRLQVKGDGDDCADTVTVTLGSPLADREIVDARTGDRVGGTDDVVP